MAFVAPTVEPLTIVAGDRVQWTRSDLGDFPSDEWTLTYYLRSSVANGQIDVTAAEATTGNGYSVDISPTTSAEYTPGVYYWTAYVSQSGDRKLVGQGRLEILTNPADVTTPVDGRSHARRTLEAIEAVIERRATTDQQRYVFQAVGRSVDRMPIKDLLEFRNYYASLVATEDAKAAIARGEGSKQNILIRFLK